jgi:hypothetical protein
MLASMNAQRVSQGFLETFERMNRRAPAGPEIYWHYCPRFEFLPIDSQSAEFEFCDCNQHDLEVRRIQRDLKAKRLSAQPTEEVWSG